jgi:hypothetical protein
MVITKYGREIGYGHNTISAIASACRNDAVLAEEIENYIKKLGYSFEEQKDDEGEIDVVNPVSSFESF